MAELTPARFAGYEGRASVEGRYAAVMDRLGKPMSAFEMGGAVVRDIKADLSTRDNVDEYDRRGLLNVIDALLETLATAEGDMVNVLTEVDREASLAHDFRANMDDAHKGDLDACIWRIHDLIRPVLAAAQPLRAYYARLADDHRKHPKVPDRGGGAPGDRFPF